VIVVDDKLVVALVAAASAIVGGVITGVVAPLVKHRLEEKSAAKQRKREQVARWRQMVLEVHHAAEGNINPNDRLQRHPEYLSIEPHLSKRGPKAALTPIG
jgi:predicted hydrolase (HD superfamily)